MAMAVERIRVMTRVAMRGPAFFIFMADELVGEG